MKLLVSPCLLSLNSSACICYKLFILQLYILLRTADLYLVTIQFYFQNICRCSIFVYDLSLNLANKTHAIQYSSRGRWNVYLILSFLMFPIIPPKILVMWYHALNVNTGILILLYIHITSIACWFTVLDRYLLYITAKNRKQTPTFLWNFSRRVTLGYVT